MSSLLIPLVFLVLGSGCLYVGAYLLVRACLLFSHKLAVSHAFSGIILMSMATSAPEVFVSMDAHMHGHTPLALNNIIGSNIANLLLVFGLVLLLSKKPPELQGKLNISVLGLSALLFLAAFYTGMPFVVGVGFLIGYGIYLYFSYRENKKEDNTRNSKTKESVLKIILFALGGTVALYFGSNYIVDSALDIAKIMGLSEGVVGISIVAIGTSLPEILTILVSRKHLEPIFLMGNIIGSNIFNTLAILGLMAISLPFSVQDGSALESLLLMCVATLVIFPLSCWKRLARFQHMIGVLMLVLYALCMYLVL